MIRFIQFLFHKMRLSEPMLYKVPVLITVTYIVIYITSIKFLIAVKFLGLSLVTIVGIAGIAYTLNDWADIEPDNIAGKVNAMANLSVFERCFLLAFFVALAVLPWFIFPFRAENILLLITELLLFWLYAFRPLRLKERPITGVVTDALYAHAIPVLLATLTFCSVADKKISGLTALQNSAPIMALVFWQLTLGLRNILLHQLKDMEKDIKSGTKTFAVVFGESVTWRLVKGFIAVEMVLFALVVVLLNRLGLHIVAAYGLFLLFSVFTNRSVFKTITKSVRSFAYLLVDDFYMDWFPLAVLVALCINDVRFAVVLALHVFLFRNVVKAKLLPAVK